MAAPNILGDAAQQVEGSWLGQKAMGMGDMLQRMSEDPWFAAAVMASMLPVGAAGGALRGARPPAAPGAAARAGRAARLRRPGMRNATVADDALPPGLGALPKARPQTLKDPFKPPSSPTEGLPGFADDLMTMGGSPKALPRGLTNQPVNRGPTGIADDLVSRGGRPLGDPAQGLPPMPPRDMTTIPPTAIRPQPGATTPMRPSPIGAEPGVTRALPPTPPPTPRAPTMSDPIPLPLALATGGATMAGLGALGMGAGSMMRGGPKVEALPEPRAIPGPMAVARKEPSAPAPTQSDSGYAPPKSFGDVFGSKGYQPPKADSMYDVKRGDTLYDIAKGLLRSQGLDDGHELAMMMVERLMQANDISDPRKLQAGSSIYTPGLRSPLGAPRGL